MRRRRRRQRVGGTIASLATNGIIVGRCYHLHLDAGQFDVRLTALRLGSLVVRASDLRLDGRQFDPRPPHYRVVSSGMGDRLRTNNYYYLKSRTRSTQ